MEWFVSLMVFSFPSLFVRIFLRKDWKVSGLWQDLFAGAQLGSLALIAPWIVPVFQLLILYDGWVFKKVHFRLEGSCLSFLTQLKDFKDSARDLKIFHFFPLFLVGALTSLLLKPLPFYWLALGIPFLFLKTDRTNDSLLILWEKQGLNYLLRPLRRAKKGFLPFVQTEVLSTREVYTSKSRECPLFRYTHGFRGEKPIDFRVDPGEKPHVMFLFIESFRAKELGALGSPRGVTPYMDRLAEQSHLFSKFYSNSLPTFRSFFTSLYGLPYCLEMKTNLDRNLSAYGLPELMRDNGYQTNFFTGADWGVGGIGAFLRRMGGDCIYDKREIEAMIPDAEGGSWGIHDEFLFKMTLDHLEKNKESPQFYSLLTITSHHPWIVPSHHHPIEIHEPLEKDYENYLKTLHYADDQVGRFVEKLKEKNLSKDLILFIMGDHGVSFGSGENELFHVPLMIYGDGRIKDPKRVDEVASQCDLLPTVMDLLSLQGYQHSIGRSLLRKEKNPRVFLHDSFKVTGSLCCEDSRGKGEYNKVTKRFSGENPEMFPFLQRFEEMLSALHDKNLLIPKAYRKKGKKLCIEMCRFSPDLSKEELLKAVYQKSPMVYLTFQENSHLSQEFLSKVSKWNPDLDTLNLNNSFSVTDEGLIQIFKQCKSLYDLRVSKCLLLTEKCLSHLPKGLMTLNLTGLDFVSDDHFIHPLKYLERLNIRETPLTDKGLRRFPSLFPTLSYLSISYYHMTMEAIVEVLDQIPLRFFSISEGEGLTDDEAIHLFAKHPSLRSLQFANCPHLTDHLFERIRETNINELYFDGIPQLTDRGLEAILKLPLNVLYIDGAPNLSTKAYDLLDQHRHRFDDVSVRILNI